MLANAFFWSEAMSSLLLVLYRKLVLDVFQSRSSSETCYNDVDTDKSFHKAKIRPLARAFDEEGRTSCQVRKARAYRQEMLLFASVIGFPFFDQEISRIRKKRTSSFGREG